METWIRALCLIGIVAAPNVVEISEAWAEPKRQAADDLMKEGWLSSLMARVSPKAADEAAPFRAVAPSPLHQIVHPPPAAVEFAAKCAWHASC
jgi:hypothetical protein